MQGGLTDVNEQCGIGVQLHMQAMRACMHTFQWCVLG